MNGRLRERSVLEGKFIDRIDQNQETFASYMNDKDFQTAVAEWMRKKVYEQVRSNASTESAVGTTG